MPRYPLETKIQVVVLMAKYDSAAMIIRELQRQGVADVPTRKTIASTYQKFLDTGLNQNVNSRGRLTAITEDKIREISACNQ